MNKWAEVLEIADSMKGYMLPPPWDGETGLDYYRRIVNGFSDHCILLSRIHSIAYEQNNKELETLRMAQTPKNIPRTPRLRSLQGRRGKKAPKAQ